ncbi:formylglycine-generating enzyme family protein [Echinicola strongylocentroti]|uniref:Formylglycine-generating enzyme family protein n=1 Tax=Echinicola strongylocentroti TaxID=1795355 RepID=A0A2Z4IQK3_9BACT|nr:formylglycine-generating enzyme family protein [Echinicola strongylocentroti]AWW32918.1 formylglycine-generating enzyme family protein [Echinicola strongylocentroti]
MLPNKFVISAVVAGSILLFNAKSIVYSDSFEPYKQEIPHTDLIFGMAPIPAGEFVMGSPGDEEGRKEDEGPQRTVSVDAFWMGTHEMTWDIFELFLNKNYEASISQKELSPEVDGLTRPSTPYLDMTFGMGKEDKPAIGMTQYGAIQFCKWLYTKTGKFYRLPTEAEWEYAARAGASTAYFFGNETSTLTEYAWFAENSEETTHKIGQKAANPWGLYDIYGNVMEWTNDAYVPQYPKIAEVDNNPRATSDELYPRVIRGGSYISEADELRSSRRFASNAKWKQIDPQIPKSRWWFPEAPFLGIRVVRPLEQPSEEEIMAYYDQAPIDDY